MPHNYPLLLDVSDRLIVIVGGGEVAVRKAQGLVDAGATRVRVVAPRFHERMPPGVQRIAETYRREHLAGASLVFASTDDPAVNEQVVADARSMNLLVCRADADDANAGDFATPAMIRKDPVLITVSTGGSPALAAKMRDAIASSIDPRWIAMAGLMQTLRPRIHRIETLTPSRRREIFRYLASDEAIDTLASHGDDGLRTSLAKRFPEIEHDLKHQ
jgi:precorrin-2 dehydrogenase / sirohydrochlorin ferrochelatase